MQARSVEHETITIERDFKAAPQRIFAAWASPKARAQWMVPNDQWESAEQGNDFRVGKGLLQHRKTEQVIGMRMRRVDDGEVLLRLEDLGGEPVGFAQRELRIDDQHVPLADHHRRVDVVADLTATGVDLQGEFRLGMRCGRERERQ